MKKIIILLSLMLLIIPSYAYANDKPFSDIQNHWAEASIIKAYEQNIIGGYNDGTFKPNNNITYGEFFVILNRLSSPYLNEIANQKDQLKTITIYSDNKFKINDLISVKVTINEDKNKLLITYPIAYAKVLSLTDDNQYEIELSAESYNNLQYIINNQLNYEYVKYQENGHWAFNSFKNILNHTYQFQLKVNHLQNQWTYESKDKSFLNNLNTNVQACYNNYCQNEELLNSYIDRDTVASILMSVYGNINHLDNIDVTLNDDFQLFNDDIKSPFYPVRLWAKDTNLFNGYKNQDNIIFNNSNITRAELVVVIDRFSQVINRQLAINQITYFFQSLASLNLINS